LKFNFAFKNYKIQLKRKQKKTIILEVRTELKRVNWPSPDTLSTFTIVTVVTVITMTLLIFGMDFGFKNTLINLLSFGE